MFAFDMNTCLIQRINKGSNEFYPLAWSAAKISTVKVIRERFNNVLDSLRWAHFDWPGPDANWNEFANATLGEYKKGPRTLSYYVGGFFV
jgi:hypothetical protein